MHRKPIKIADISQALPEVFKSLRENEAIIWMEGHQLKYKLANDDNIYNASGITLIDSNNKKMSVTPDTVLRIAGSQIKSSSLTKSGNIVTLNLSLNVSASTVVDSLPNATVASYGVIKLSADTESNSIDLGASEWLANFQRIHTQEHSQILDIYKNAPVVPKNGDAYISGGNSFIYNKFTQPIRIVGAYSVGDGIIAVINPTKDFTERIKTQKVYFGTSSVGYNLTPATVTDEAAFFTEHGISPNFVSVLTYYNVATSAGGKLASIVSQDDLCYSIGWEKSMISVKPYLDAVSAAEWQTL